MSNVLVEGFGTYGLGSSTAVNNAMLAGAWAAIATTVGVFQLPWDANSDLYLRASGQPGFNAEVTRRVLPSALGKVRVSLHYALPNLPSGIYCRMMQFRDADNLVVAELRVSPTGAIRLMNGAAQASQVVLAATSSPVLAAETDAHLELELNRTTGTFVLYVQGAKVIDASGLTFSNGTTIASIGVTPLSDDNFAPPVETIMHYFNSLVVRDDAGGVNDTFPIGDRRVATLFVNRDDSGHQGWTARPLERFGTGVLDLTADQAAVLAPITVSTDLGSNDFTLEGQFRLQALPTGSNKAVLCGKWDESTNLRSYELYLGGPSLESGALVFRTSTNGTSGTVVEKLTWPWAPAIGHWYHVAMCRDAGDLKLFIDGVMQGEPIADGDTYFVSTARAALGGQANGAAPLVNTQWHGWMDEWRMTVGLSRYSANFAPPTEAFPRGGDDPDWSDVRWLSSWDTGSITDDGPLALALFGSNGAAAITPDDGSANYQVIDKHTPDDDTFLEAALIPAFGTLTLTANAANTNTVTVGTTDGSTPAVYTFKTALASAYDVLRGATQLDSVNNLIAAINAAAGEGVTYGTGTAANFDVVADLLPSGQMLVTALIPGTGGNSIASTETLANGSWGDTTLDGGEDIPAWSAFGFDRLPRDAVIVDSVTFQTRQWKTDAGVGTTQMTFLGVGGGTLAGAANNLSVTPTLYFDLFEEDPDTTSTLTPQSILSGEIKVNRTA